MEKKYATKKYQVISPDGFTIEFAHPYYTSKKKAIAAFEKWKERYVQQGYYSSARCGIIQLEDLDQYCDFKVF
jgi:hypothetical protein